MLSTTEPGSQSGSQMGLKELAGLKQLRSLNLAATQVTDAGVLELRKALPKVRITR